MLKKMGIVFTIALLAASTLANTPPTDPDGEVVYAPYGPTPGDGSYYSIPHDPSRPVTLPLAEGVSLASFAVTQDHTVTCFIFANTPWKSRSKARGDGVQECSGNVAPTRLKFALQRHKAGPWWVTLHYWDSGWVPVYNIYRAGPGSCATGEHTYPVIVDGNSRDTTGNERSRRDVSDHERITCWS